MNDAALMIAANSILRELPESDDVETVARAAMKEAQDDGADGHFWVFYVTSDDMRFRSAVGALLLKYKDDAEVKERIESEMRTIQALSSAMKGVPVDFAEVTAREEDSEPLGLMNLYREAKPK